MDEALINDGNDDDHVEEEGEEEEVLIMIAEIHSSQKVSKCAFYIFFKFFDK